MSYCPKVFDLSLAMFWLYKSATAYTCVGIGMFFEQVLGIDTLELTRSLAKNQITKIIMQNIQNRTII